jgi:hypothetical protein
MKAFDTDIRTEIRLHLFSGSAADLEYGASHYQRRSAETSPLLDQLFTGYRGEGLAMPYTMEDFKRDYLKELTPEERLEGLSPEERLEGLSPEEIESVLKKRKAERKPPPRKPRRRK